MSSDLGILSPEHPRWDEFVSRLDLEGEKMGGCDLTHRHSKKVMTEMGGIDVDATLEFFRGHGGYCDCEVLVNVEPW
jgi:hypothetical protein